MSNRVKRRIYLIKKKFQFRVIGVIILISAIFATVTGITLYGLLNEAFGFSYLKSLFGAKEVSDILVPVIIITQLVGLIVIAVIGLFVSHRMAGPIYRLEKVAEQIGDGDLSFKVRLRKGDEFQELADAIDTMVRKLRERVSIIKEVASDLIKKQEALQDVAAKRDVAALQAEIEDLAGLSTVLNNVIRYVKTE